MLAAWKAAHAPSAAAPVAAAKPAAGSDEDGEEQEESEQEAGEEEPVGPPEDLVAYAAAMSKATAYRGLLAQRWAAVEALAARRISPPADVRSVVAAALLATGHTRAEAGLAPLIFGDEANADGGAGSAEAPAASSWPALRKLLSAPSFRARVLALEPEADSAHDGDLVPPHQLRAALGGLDGESEADRRAALSRVSTAAVPLLTLLVAWTDGRAAAIAKRAREATVAVEAATVKAAAGQAAAASAASAVLDHPEGEADGIAEDDEEEDEAAEEQGEGEAADEAE